MNTEFLNNLGITEKATVDAIFAEYGKDLNALKAEKEQLETQVATLNTEIANRDNQLKDLKNANKDNEALTNKITQLEEDNKTAKANFEQQILNLKKDHALEKELKKQGAKNIKAVLPFLDMENIKYDEKSDTINGLEDMVKSLKENEDTIFLFNTESNNDPAPNQNNPFFGFTPDPSGSNTGGNGNNGGSNNPNTMFASLVAQRLGANTPSNN